MSNILEAPIAFPSNSECTHKNDLIRIFLKEHNDFLGKKKKSIVVQAVKFKNNIFLRVRFC